MGGSASRPGCLATTTGGNEAPARIFPTTARGSQASAGGVLETTGSSTLAGGRVETAGVTADNYLRLPLHDIGSLYFTLFVSCYILL